jgi:uncharacterized membrane protein YccF (DUF307 family)
MSRILWFVLGGVATAATAVVAALMMDSNKK